MDWFEMPAWNIKGYDHPLTADEQDHLLYMFRLNQRCLVVHFGFPTAQRVGRAYSPGGAREVFFARGQAGFNAETQRNAEKRRGRKRSDVMNTAGLSHIRSARSVWSARSLLPLSGTRHRSKAPASWTHSKRFARQFVVKNPRSLGAIPTDAVRRASLRPPP